MKFVQQYEKCAHPFLLVKHYSGHFLHFKLLNKKYEYNCIKKKSPASKILNINIQMYGQLNVLNNKRTYSADKQPLDCYYYYILYCRIMVINALMRK